MIAVIARMKVQDGKADEFEQVMGELAAQVRDKEPGCALYTLARGQEAGQYAMIERYADQEALGVHAQSEHFQAAIPKLGQLLDGAPQIELLTEID